jgi:AcrR family transcriptional regulator
MPRTPKITNEAILAAAREVFLAQGMGASTLEIADRAGISEASIFKRFTTKQALFLAAIGIAETPKWVKALSSRTPTANIKSELTDICSEMLAFYQEVLPRVMMMMAPGNLPHLTQSPPPPIRDSQLLAEFLERAIDQGYLRVCDPNTIAHMIVGGITNYVAAQAIASQSLAEAPQGGIVPQFAIPKHPQREPSQFIQHLIETLWMGIAPEC